MLTRKGIFQLFVLKKLNIHHEVHEEKQEKLLGFLNSLKFLRVLRDLRGLKSFPSKVYLVKIDCHHNSVTVS